MSPAAAGFWKTCHFLKAQGGQEHALQSCKLKQLDSQKVYRESYIGASWYRLNSSHRMVLLGCKDGEAGSWFIFTAAASLSVLVWTDWTPLWTGLLVNPRTPRHSFVVSHHLQKGPLPHPWRLRQARLPLCWWLRSCHNPCRLEAATVKTGGQSVLEGGSAPCHYREQK